MSASGCSDLWKMWTNKTVAENYHHSHTFILLSSIIVGQLQRGALRRCSVRDSQSDHPSDDSQTLTCSEQLTHSVGEALHTNRHTQKTTEQRKTALPAVRSCTHRTHSIRFIEHTRARVCRHKFHARAQRDREREEDPTPPPQPPHHHPISIDRASSSSPTRLLDHATAAPRQHGKIARVVRARRQLRAALTAAAQHQRSASGGLTAWRLHGTQSVRAVPS